MGTTPENQIVTVPFSDIEAVLRLNDIMFQPTELQRVQLAFDRLASHLAPEIATASTLMALRTKQGGLALQTRFNAAGQSYFGFMIAQITPPSFPPKNPLVSYFTLMGQLEPKEEKPPTLKIVFSSLLAINDQGEIRDYNANDPDYIQHSLLYARHMLAMLSENKEPNIKSAQDWVSQQSALNGGIQGAYDRAVADGSFAFRLERTTLNPAAHVSESLRMQ